MNACAASAVTDIAILQRDYAVEDATWIVNRRTGPEMVYRHPGIDRPLFVRYENGMVIVEVHSMGGRYDATSVVGLTAVRRDIAAAVICAATGRPMPCETLPSISSV